jgi:hypothetical protein
VGRAGSALNNYEEFYFIFGLFEILLSIIKAYLTSKKMHNNYLFSLFFGILREGILNIWH